MAFIKEHSLGWTTAYAVMSKGRFNRGKAFLVKDFYSKKDAEKYRDMLNGKIAKDEAWMYSC